MEKKLLSEQEILGESFVDSESNLGEERNGVVSRRDAIKKTLMAAVAFSLSTIPVDVLADNNADKAKEKKEAERKEIYELVRQLGLEKIKIREPLTLKFYLEKTSNELWTLLKIRFEGSNKSAIFEEMWKAGDKEPLLVNQFSIDDYEKLLKYSFDAGLHVLPV